MQSFMVVAKSETVFETIRSGLSPGVRLAFTPDPDKALAFLEKTRFDAVLIDEAFLIGSAEGNQIKETLTPFWYLYPSIELFIMVSPDNIRTAVKAVKAGASDYLAYPIQVDELKIYHRVDL